MSHANDRGIDADIMHRKPTGILLLSDAKESVCWFSLIPWSKVWDNL